jgi:phosphatidylethanolamine/phosphatidyl-N-methylethanolamine N-methyltransferase
VFAWLGSFWRLPPILWRGGGPRQSSSGERPSQEPANRGAWQHAAVSSVARATSWNRLRYTLWASFYDLVVRFGRQRRRAVELLALRAGEDVLIVGAGTGADLPYLPPHVRVVATDLTPAMLERARPKARPGVRLEVMDAHRLDLPDGAFDAVLLHLILAVVPDPVACLSEASRVLRPGGRISVFDKFVPEGGRPSFARRIVNLPARLLATDITRVLEDVLAASAAPLRKEHDEPAGLGGAFRLVVLRKPAPSSVGPQP